MASQRALITGCSTGIGRATAVDLHARGYEVIATARRLETIEDLEVAGTLALDVDSDESVANVVAAAGPIDVLVNNAGFGRLDWLENLDPKKDIESQFEVNVLGLVQTTRQALPAMIRQRQGHIINMCSMAGLIATPTYTIYAACKHAVHGFSEALRREVKPWGIHVSLIYPGGVATEFNQHTGYKRKTGAGTPRILSQTAAEVGRAVVELVRRPRAMRLIPWLWIFPALLNKLFPSIVDYIMVNKFTIPERAEELKAS